MEDDMRKEEKMMKKKKKEEEEKQPREPRRAIEMIGSQRANRQDFLTI